MKSIQTQRTDNRARVAVPYYGALVHPQTGLATIYFIAEVDVAARRILGLQMRVWDGIRNPHLSLWLYQQDVCGLICQKTNSPHLGYLRREGLWVHFGRNRDAEEMVVDWLRQYDPGSLRRLVA